MDTKVDWIIHYVFDDPGHIHIFAMRTRMEWRNTTTWTSR